MLFHCIAIQRYFTLPQSRKIWHNLPFSLPGRARATLSPLRVTVIKESTASFHVDWDEQLYLSRRGLRRDWKSADKNKNILTVYNLSILKCTNKGNSSIASLAPSPPPPPPKKSVSVFTHWTNIPKWKWCCLLCCKS